MAGVNCIYCGTGLVDDPDGLEEATGETHHASKCREYVYQVKEHAKAELRQAEAENTRLREALAACQIAARAHILGVAHVGGWVAAYAEAHGTDAALREANTRADEAATATLATPPKPEGT